MVKLKTLSEEISDIFTPEGAKKVKVGQVLTFNYEGSPIHMKITHKNNARVWAKRIELYREDEINIVDKRTGKVL